MELSEQLTSRKKRKVIMRWWWRKIHSSETGYTILSSEKSPRGTFIICTTYNNTLRRFFMLKICAV